MTYGISAARSFFLRALPLAVLLALAPQASARVYSGLEALIAKHMSVLQGKRVGLVTNQTAVDIHLRHTVDVLRADGRVNLVALFAPEHGIRGDVQAGEQFEGGRDPVTGLPIYTLYGKNGHKPTKEALSKIDVILYDIQDVGSRTYTYIWHLAECMKAAAESGKTVVVLDRPNPLGAEVVDGPLVDPAFKSFIGLHPIPRVYGMTVGELARYLNTEEKIGCRLQVVPMVNYKRGMSWEQTGLPWVPTSPYVPSPQSAYCYAATGTLGEVGIFNIGIGYTLPFQTVAAPWMDGAAMTEYLNGLELPGVRFRTIHYKPFYGAYKDQMCSGVQIHVTDPSKFKPPTTEMALICFARDKYPSYFKWNKNGFNMFDKAMGSDSIRKAITRGDSFRTIVGSWKSVSEDFEQKRQKYLIYK